MRAGGSPAGFRATNLLIHFVASMLVGGIAFRLASPVPAPERSRGARHVARATGLAAALLFAAHPLATQSVTYLTQRITALAAVWMLGATAAYLEARDSRGERWWALSWGLALLAALTKEMAVALPFALMFLE